MINFFGDKFSKNVEVEESERLIIDAINTARSKRQVATITGASRTGKTTAVMNYHMNNTGTILVKADPYMLTKDFIGKMLSQIGEKSKTGRTIDLLTKLINKIKGKDLVIIIDQADWMSYFCVQQINQIVKGSGIGVVLVGHSINGNGGKAWLELKDQIQITKEVM